MPFDVSALVGHPFFAATLALAILGWFVAFISACVAASHSFLPGYSWFAVFFELVLLIGIIVAIGSDGIVNYRFAILTFLAVGIILTTLAVEDNVYAHISSNSGVAAGMILLAASNFLFVFVFGSEENTVVSRSINGLAVPRTGGGTGFGSGAGVGGNSFGFGKSTPTNNHTTSSRNDALGAGAVGAGVGAGAGAGAGLGAGAAASPSGGAPPAHAPSSAGGLTSPTSPPPSAAPGSQNGPPAAAGASPQQDTYTYQAKALYSYEANPSDPNELSFNKGDILSIVDNSGKWWQARRGDGSVGIVPSNYLSLL